MRTVIDHNDTFQIVKLSNRKGTFGYQVENLTQIPGSENYITKKCNTLDEARKASGLVPLAPVNITLPKSAYPEQQTGFSRK